MSAPLTPEQLLQQKQSAQLGVAMAVGQVVGDIAVGLFQNKTQRDFNTAKIAAMNEDSRLKYLSAEERLAFDKKVASAVNDTARLRIYDEELTKLGIASIQSTASLYATKLKAQSDAQNRGYYILGGLAALLIVGTIYIIKKNK